MNPPPAWSKPASALGLNNPLSHLPQSQQVRQLQEQIQQHRRLQHQQSHGYGIGGHSMKKKNSQSSTSGANSSSSSGNNNNSGGTGTGTTRTDPDRTCTFPQQGHQHINIKNTDDMNSDEDIEEDDEEDEDDDKSEDRNNQNGMQGLHHHRNISHPQLTQGFAISGGFTAFAPSSPLSPSSPGSIASDSGSMTSSMLSPGLLSPSSNGFSHHHQQQHSHGHGGGNGSSIHGLETSLASLASLSVIPSSSSGGSSSATTIPMSMPNGSRGRTVFSSHHSSHLATTPTTSSFQPQSLPMIYQGHNGTFLPTPSVSGGQTTPFAAFSSALTHNLQRQQQQQQQQPQQMTSTAMSSSLPAHTNFNPFQHQQQTQSQQQQSEPQSPQLQQQQPPRSRSKSLTIPAPRIIPPSRILPPRVPQMSAPRKYHGRQTRKLPNALSTPKEVIDPTRRVAHIISEQKRREKINGGFEELKSVIP
ncbi:hypothetical protein BGZ65_004924, partial [Modicella reniformis]